MCAGISGEKENILKNFEALLIDCYGGSLKLFCHDFRNNDESFYKKVQKSRLRMKEQQVSPRTLDDFKKYIFFLEYKKLEVSSKDKASFRNLDIKFNEFLNNR